jgi:WhiB family redox-sensing transcriptional regulator
VSRPGVYTLLPELERPDWMERGACAGMGTTEFFPTVRSKAPQICHRCPVRPDCLEYALDHRIIDGAWGGVSERDRRKMLK